MKAELDQVALHLDAAEKSLDAGYSNGAWSEISNAVAILDNLTNAIMQESATVALAAEPEPAMAMAAAA
jgi:hypothetical protein